MAANIAIAASNSGFDGKTEMPGSADSRESKNRPERGHERTDRSSEGLSATRVLAQRIILCDVILPCHIGATAEERAQPQQVRINMTLEVTPRPPVGDDLGQVLNYSRVVAMVQEICRTSRFKLVESLADALAARCFEFPPVEGTIVKIEKLERYAEMTAIGIEIERRRPDC
jgi:dihydroneopterin aldolase